VHNGFITIDKEKMSKSLGNFFTIRDILDKYSPEVIRLFLLSSHYRSPIEFSHEQLRDAESSLDRFYSTVSRMDDFIAKAADAVGKGISQGCSLETMLAEFKTRFEEAMDDDFNTAIALGLIFELVREINRCLDLRPSGTDAAKLIMRAKDVLKHTGTILNLFDRTPHAWNVDLLKVKKIALSESDIEEKIIERKRAREIKDWAKADAVRKELEDSGIILEDKKDETSWKIKIV
jgi:cysteinyl-tRNA synthetase